MIPRAAVSKEEHEDVSVLERSPNNRRGILERTLRDGAAWETPTVELLAAAVKTKKKFIKKRMGNKAAKAHERLECVGDLLDEDASTMFRAVAARFL